MNVLLGVALVLGVAPAGGAGGLRPAARPPGPPAAPRPAAVTGPVSVIVPAYNEAANIAATVRSLVASDYPALEVIVVDDGSTDGTADIVERLRLPGVRVIRQANAGKPAALNTGIRAARADLLVLVDGDTVFEPDAVGPARAAASPTRTSARSPATPRSPTGAGCSAAGSTWST